MQILILVIVSLILSCVATGYLSYDLNNESRDFKSLISNICKHKKYVVYIVFMLLCLCGVSVALPMLYETNTIARNIKLITLLVTLFVVAVIDYKRHIIPNKIIAATLVLRVPFYILELVTETDNFSA